MKPLHIVLLLGAGAAAGALVMTIAQRHQPVARPAQIARVLPQTPAAQPPVPQTPPAATPAQEPKPLPESTRPSPWEAPKPGRTHTHAAPPKRPAEQQAVVRSTPPPVVAAPPTEQPVTPPAVQEPVAAPATPPARVEPENATPPPPPPPPEPAKVTLNAGTLLPVRLVDGLNAERNKPGDTFTATLEKELAADGFVIAERGARVEGRVTDVDPGGRVRGVSTLSVELTRLHTSDGQNVTIQTDAFQRRAQETHGADAAKIGAGAAIGAAIGAIAGGGKGAAIGAGAGGAAGTGAVLATRGKPAALPSETHVNFRLSAPVTLTERR
ncbi:MAG TPA: hypothetical protein VMH28_01005 [Candidatus Acidoferrales bacterium]|nr:hypothetical protein [Candidatus Acidoferrales bacterium]